MYSLVIALTLLSFSPTMSHAKTPITQTQALQIKLQSAKEKMVLRLYVTVNRIEKLISRLESRIAKIESSGDIKSNPDKLTLSNSKKELDRAKLLLTNTKKNIDSLKSELSSPKPVDKTTQIKTATNQVNTIKSDLQQVHKILTKVIGNLKGLRIGTKS